MCLLGMCLFFLFWCHLFFFFFQAEDGIRDLYVTGVQTCALPILRRHTVRVTNAIRPQTTGAVSFRRMLGSTPACRASPSPARTRPQRRLRREWRNHGLGTVVSQSAPRLPPRVE